MNNINVIIIFFQIIKEEKVTLSDVINELVNLPDELRQNKA